ncbi:hypothetical protein AAFN85_06540 [Mucilaginibacter sp. CAU 1740]|uniref:hypothetical protein n=1 Tax=Mucilaginibacter sp. CAU 1740 TaxID=3140365 RepID=UPI00325BE003
MNDKKFKTLLKVINVLSIISLEKYWKNGVKISFKKKKNDTSHSSKVVQHPAATEGPKKIAL